ncbi:SAM-dependent methyltransferase [Paracidovorax avenae]|nr:SAM-dependent methyltransferase [Paracidovorax avenae]
MTTPEPHLAYRLDTMSAVMGVVAALVPKKGVTALERTILDDFKPAKEKTLLAAVVAAVQAGEDPLGNAYCALNSPEARRGRGQTFTPDSVVEGMLTWVRRQRKSIVRLVDPGAGSGRFTLAALRMYPKAEAVAAEMDPTVALILRANLIATGFADRTEVRVGDFRDLKLPAVKGTTLFIGNPPYVRHHDIGADWKEWYSRTLRRFGHDGSKLAGLHLHFFLKTLELGNPGDLGCYVTAAEWLDVKYGQALRQLLTNGLGGMDVFVVDPEVQIFGDALVSAAITGFSHSSARTELRFAEVGSKAQLRKLSAGTPVAVAAAKAEPKWSFLVKGGRAAKPKGFVELGEMFKVSRGQVTGLNRVWIAKPGAPDLPSRFLVPAITDSTDITGATRGVIDNSKELRRLVCLPRDLQELPRAERDAVDRFLEWARRQGAHETYIARHRNPWWSVSTKEPAPIVMTYMGRRPPAFALNKANAQLINVAHGLYPRRNLDESHFGRLVAWLNENVEQTDGRVYAGGLTKFEPSEAMRILVPGELAL